MLASIIGFLAEAFPFYRAAQDAGIERFMNDLQSLSEALNPRD